jgi:hypothetical protein
MLINRNINFPKVNLLTWRVFLKLLDIGDSFLFPFFFLTMGERLLSLAAAGCTS